MVTSTEVVHIARARAEGFASTVDLGGLSRWHHDIDGIRHETSGELEVGDLSPATFRPFLGEMEGTVAAVEVVLDERLVLETVLARLTSTITCTHAVEGLATRFTRRIDVPRRGMLRLVGQLVARRVRQDNRRTVASLKRMLENY